MSCTGYQILDAEGGQVCRVHCNGCAEASALRAELERKTEALTNIAESRFGTPAWDLRELARRAIAHPPAPRGMAPGYAPHDWTGGRQPVTEQAAVTPPPGVPPTGPDPYPPEAYAQKPQPCPKCGDTDPHEWHGCKRHYWPDRDEAYPGVPPEKDPR